MFHYQEGITNTAGDALIGYFVRVIDPATGNVVTIASDNSGTPIATVSGQANMAKTDSAGMASFYVAAGNYHLDVYAPDAVTFNKRFPDIAMGDAITLTIGTVVTGSEADASVTGSSPDYVLNLTLPASDEPGPPGTVATNTGLTVTDNATTAQTQILWSPPQSAINSEGGYDNVDMKLLTSKNYIANFGDGTFGTDYVFGLGWNCNQAFSPAKAGLPAVSYRIESKYRYNRLGAYVTQAEIHVGALFTADASSPAEFRPWTIGAPHFKADWANLSSITSQIAYISWADGSLAGTEWMAWDARASNGGTRYITTFSGVRREETNALAWLRQKNAGGTFTNLPYVDATNAYHFDRDVFAQINTPLTNGLGAQCYYCVQGVGTLTTGAYLIYMSTPAVTGSYWAFLFDGNASTYINGEIKNGHASGSARLDLTANGDTSILFTHSASGRTGTLKFGNSGRRLESDVPVKLPVYTVATLPTVANAGTGARAFVSDANATTFNSTVAGGGSNFMPVFSDGTNWKIG